MIRLTEVRVDGTDQNARGRGQPVRIPRCSVLLVPVGALPSEDGILERDGDLMKRFLTVVVAPGLAIGLLVVGAGMASAEAPIQTEVRARLLPGGGAPDPSARGGVKLRTRSRGDSEDLRFHARFDTDFLTAEDAEAAMFVLVVDTEGGATATCDLDFDEFDELLGRAEYNVNLRQRNGDLKENAGTCVGGIPAVVDGGSARIEDGDGLIQVEGVFFQTR